MRANYLLPKGIKQACERNFWEWVWGWLRETSLSLGEQRKKRRAVLFKLLFGKR